MATEFERVRRHSLRIAEPLSPEDQCVQSMPDASPVKWHLAHTTWFFERLVLQVWQPAYTVFDAGFDRLFNSYYESLGERHPRAQRGLLTRPDAALVRRYRAHVDAGVLALMAELPAAEWEALAERLVLGLHHEQQHQELMYTDVKHLLHHNPLWPAYATEPLPGVPAPAEVLPGMAMGWTRVAAGLSQAGHAGEGFAFDNELPRHATLLSDAWLADRLVSCGEYLAFVRDGGYERHEFWFSDGWAKVRSEGWRAPLYWHDLDAAHPTVFTLSGLRPVDLLEPVAHVSYYEAAAFAQWAQARLPTEFEWEAACTRVGPENMPEAMRSEAAAPHPRAANPRRIGLQQMTGEVWQWTASSYEAYPGYRPLPGAVGEYNGKFMVGQRVLRGSSCATPAGHTRSSYRNFFPPEARWQFSGIRLAKNA
ncbi:MAG: ergothioneine biosynthesis protein EgtB [Pseudomonadota bacterium]